MKDNENKNNVLAKIIALLIIPVLLFGVWFVSKGYLTDQNSTEKISSNQSNTKSKKEDARQQKTKAKSATTKEKQSILLKYTGDDKAYYLPKYLNSREQAGYEALNFEVDLFPTTNNDFLSLIPKDKIDKYIKRKEKQFVLHFTNPDFPTVKMRHRVKAKFANLQLDELKYDGFKNNSSTDKSKLTLKRFSKKYGTLNGTISRYDGTKTKPILKEKFSIKFIKSEYDRLKQEDKLDLGGPYDKYQPYTISGLKDDNLKNVVLNNLAVVHNKQLKLGNYYTLSDVAYYSPSESKNPQFEVNPIEVGRGSLTFARGSMEDEIAICTLNGKAFQIRYFVGKDTKKVLGMHMVVHNDDTNQTEVIEAFYE